jgi:hypothetical protein
MKFHPPLFLYLLVATLCSCQSTAPNVADMDRYYKEAERRANVQIEKLEQQRASGQMGKEEFDYRAQLVRDDIPRKANDMAWTRHDLAETEKRALGLPTGGSNVGVSAPQVGGIQGSLYRRRGDPSGTAGNTNQRMIAPTSNAGF